MKRSLSAILVLAFLFGCKKEKLPEAQVKDPVFKFSGTIDGTTEISRQAGNEDYYMFASHSQQSNGLYVYQGDLRKTTCPGNCDWALTVKINDAKISLLNEPMQPDKALFEGPYLLQDLTREVSSQKIVLMPARAYSFSETYIWKIVGPDSVPATNTFSIAPTLKLGGTYTVQLAFDDNVGACQKTFSNVYRVGSNFQAEITAAPLSNANYKFTPKITGDGPFTYSWEFGDGMTVSEKEPTHQYAKDSTYTVKLTVTKGQDVSVTYYQVGSCNANFLIQPQPLDLTKLFKNITFELRDSHGNLYTSAGVVQPSWASANVDAISNYDPQNGYATKKLDISFSCSMKGPDKVISFTNGKATIAVSYQ